MRRDAGRVLVALVRERRYRSYFLPKGSVEHGESLEMAARREIVEEAGLVDLELLADLGVQERLNYRKDAWKTIHYFLFLTRQQQGRPTDRDHGYVCEWFDLNGLPELFWPEQQYLLEDNRDLILKKLEQLPE